MACLAAPAAPPFARKEPLEDNRPGANTTFSDAILAMKSVDLNSGAKLDEEQSVSVRGGKDRRRGTVLEALVSTAMGAGAATAAALDDWASTASCLSLAMPELPLTALLSRCTDMVANPAEMCSIEGTGWAAGMGTGAGAATAWNAGMAKGPRPGTAKAGTAAGPSTAGPGTTPATPAPPTENAPSVDRPACPGASEDAVPTFKPMANRRARVGSRRRAGPMGRDPSAAAAAAATAPPPGTRPPGYIKLNGGMGIAAGRVGVGTTAAAAPGA